MDSSTSVFASKSVAKQRQNLATPTVLQSHRDGVTTLGKSRRPPQSPAETPQNPRRDPRRGPWESSERQLSSESLAEACAPRMVTLRNFRSDRIPKSSLRQERPSKSQVHSVLISTNFSVCGLLRLGRSLPLGEAFLLTVGAFWLPVG